jgi:hypothetical protein
MSTMKATASVSRLLHRNVVPVPTTPTRRIARGGLRRQPHHAVRGAADRSYTLFVPATGHEKAYEVRTDR